MNQPQAVLEEEAIEVELLPALDAGMALNASDRAQIDIQISTARRYPRNIDKAIKDAIALVTVDQETAESMHYALERTDQNGKKVWIIGPSVRAAEILVYTWGNLRAEARIVGEDESFVTAQATCMDLEKNIGVRMETRRRITNKKGKRYGDDMIVTTSNAAAAIAFRNAVFKIIPAAVAKRVFDAASKKATGGETPLEVRRDRAFKWFAQMGKSLLDVCGLLKIDVVNDVTEEHIKILSGIRNSIQEGDATIESVFNGGEASAGEKPTLNEKLKEQPAQPKA